MKFRLKASTTFEAESFAIAARMVANHFAVVAEASEGDDETDDDPRWLNHIGLLLLEREDTP